MKIKKKKHSFKRQDFQLKKLKNKWRKPKGLHSKLRLKKEGHQKRPNVGYKNPKELRNLFLSKFKFIKINNIKDLEKAKDNIVLSKNLGSKKKVEIIEEALKLKLNVLNLKNPEEFIKNIKEKLGEKKKDMKKKEEKKEVKKPKETIEEKEIKETIEEKEIKEKELKRKILEGKKQK